MLRSKAEVSSRYAVRAAGAQMDGLEPWLCPSLPFVDPVGGGVVKGQGQGSPLIDRLGFYRLLFTAHILLHVPGFDRVHA